MILKQKKSVIKLATRRKNLFVLDIWVLLSKTMLSKKWGKTTYLLTKNSQIKFLH